MKINAGTPKGYLIVITENAQDHAADVFGKPDGPDLSGRDLRPGF